MRKDRKPSKVQRPRPIRYYVYMVECCDRSFYTGYSRDVEARVSQHNAGRGAKYTRSRRPVVLVYQEAFRTQRAAMLREIAIKRMPRKRKTRLIEKPGLSGGVAKGGR